MTVLSNPIAPRHRFSVEGETHLLTVELPLLESLRGVDLDIGAKEIQLLLPGNSEHLRMPLPFKLLNSSSLPTAKFSRNRGELTVTWDAALLAPSTDAKTAAQIAPNVEPVDPSATNPIEDRCHHAGISAGDPGLAGKDAANKIQEFDCLELFEQEIEHVLKHCTVTKLKSIAPLGGSNVLLDGFAFSGYAKVKNHRCHFDVAVSFTWEALDPFGGFLGAAGSGQVLGFTSEQRMPKVTLRVSPGGSARAKAAGEWMKQQGVLLISECLNSLEIGAAVLAEWDDILSVATPTVTAPTLLEQKALTQWAETWLKEKLADLSVKLFGGAACVSFVSPRVSGEASMSLQEGKPTAFFQLRLESKWIMATSRGEVEGSLSVPAFTSTQAPESTEVVVEAAPDLKVSGQLLTGFRKTGVSAVQSVLARFVSELQVKLKG